MTENNNTDNNRIQRIKNAVRSYPDFPKKGILFRDMFPILLDWSVFNDLVQELLCQIKSKFSDVQAIVALESRGFLVGPHLSLALKIPFVPVRKKGKLPGLVEREEYQLEYGSDAFEIQRESIANGMKVVIFDDLLATGGSLGAAIKLVQKCGGQVLECSVVMELVSEGLGGRQRLENQFNLPVYSMIQF